MAERLSSGIAARSDAVQLKTQFLVSCEGHDMDVVAGGYKEPCKLARDGKENLNSERWPRG